MMGPKQEAQGALFYEFSLEDHVPGDHLLRSIDRFVDLTGKLLVLSGTGTIHRGPDRQRWLRAPATRYIKGLAANHC
jgi:hypothetical protein